MAHQLVAGPVIRLKASHRGIHVVGREMVAVVAQLIEQCYLGHAVADSMNRKSGTQRTGKEAPAQRRKALR